MELVFKEELEVLIDTLEGLEEFIKGIEYEVEDEIDCYVYISDYEYEEIQKSIFMSYDNELKSYKSELKKLINSYFKSIPEVFENNLFAIGKVRREEILTLLSKAMLIIDNLACDDIDLIEEIKNEILDYVSKDIKYLVNERKRQNRRNELGFTKREQKKQDTIYSILELKQQGLTQIQVSSKLKLSKGLVSRYWNPVYLNGKWEILQKKNKKECNDLTLEDEGLTLEDEDITLEDEGLTL